MSIGWMMGIPLHCCWLMPSFLFSVYIQRSQHSLLAIVYCHFVGCPPFQIYFHTKSKWHCKFDETTEDTEKKTFGIRCWTRFYVIFSFIFLSFVNHHTRYQNNGDETKRRSYHIIKYCMTLISGKYYQIFKERQSTERRREVSDYSQNE